MRFVSWLYERYATFVDAPVFPTHDLAWAKLLRDNYQSIMQEYSDYTRNHYMPKNLEVDPLPQPHTSASSAWRVLIIRLFYRDTALAKCFPVTLKLIAQMPHKPPFVMFSVLEPGAGLAPHVGYYKGVLRYHLGLSVPSHAADLDDLGRPLCVMHVDKHQHVWANGHDILFDDCWLHEVRNHTGEARVVLLIDVPRPFKGMIWRLLNTAVLRLGRANEMSKTFFSNIQRAARRDRIATAAVTATAAATAKSS